MTLGKVITLALARVGLNTTSDVFKDRARDYFNLGAADLASRRKWRWLFKTATLSTTASTGTYSLAADVSRARS